MWSGYEGKDAVRDDDDDNSARRNPRPLRLQPQSLQPQGSHGEGDNQIVTPSSSHRTSPGTGKRPPSPRRKIFKTNLHHGLFFFFFLLNAEDATPTPATTPRRRHLAPPRPGGSLRVEKSLSSVKIYPLAAAKRIRNTRSAGRRRRGPGPGEENRAVNHADETPRATLAARCRADVSGVYDARTSAPR